METSVGAVYGYIYLIRNRVNGKVYVGKTTKTPLDRWLKHQTEARIGRGYTFHRAIRAHGVDAFELLELHRAESRAQLDALEIDAIRKFDATDSEKGYNIAIGGQGGEMGASTREKISEKMRGRTFSEETRQAMREAASQRKVSGETRGRMSAAQKGRKATPETRIKLSAVQKRLRASGWNPFGADSARKAAATLRGRKHSDERRANLREAMNRPEVKAKQIAGQIRARSERGPQVRTEEQKQRLREGNLGKKLSEELKAAIRAALNEPESKAHREAAAKILKADPVYREARRKQMVGNEPPNKGIKGVVKDSEETIQRKRDAAARRNPEEVSRKLREALADPAVRARMSAAARLRGERKRMADIKAN